MRLPPSHEFCCGLALLWIWLLWASPLGAQAPEPYLIRNWQAEDGLPSNLLRGLAQGADGYLWIATAEGAVRFDGALLSTVPEESEAALLRQPMQSVQSFDDGDIWLVSTSGEVLRWQERHLQKIAEAEAFAPRPKLTRLEGKVWIRKGHTFLRVRPDGATEMVEKASELGSRLSRANSGGTTLALEDRHGRRWVAHAGGWLEVTERQGSRFLPSFGSEIVSLFEDREGSLWVATSGAGLFQIRARRVDVHLLGRESTNAAVQTVLVDRTGALWAAGKTGGIERLAHQETTHFRLGREGQEEVVSAQCEDPGGILWVATRQGHLWRRQGGEFFQVNIPRLAGQVLSMVGDTHGKLWLGSGEGLWRLNGGLITKVGADTGLQESPVTALSWQEPDTLWVGSSDGLFRGEKGQFTKIQGFPASFRGRAISGILPENGRLWIATLGGGLFLGQQGRFFRFGEPQGLPDSRLTCLLPGDSEQLWLGSLGGIFRVSKADLIEVATGHRAKARWLQLDRSDGLMARECSGGPQPAGWRGPDGVLWFATLKGLASIRPATLELHAVPPKVTVEKARGSGLGASWDASGLRAGPGLARLEFSYSAPSFLSPERVRFRVQLKGLPDSHEVEMGSQRTAAFEAVPPGRYEFVVQAENADGVGAEEVPAVRVEVLPQFWQTLWFRVGAASAAVLMAGIFGWQVARNRLRHRLLLLEMQTVREKERTRIARDLHDELGASLTEISLLAQLGAEKESPHPELLKDVDGKVQQALGALDEIVWAVNTRHDNTLSFVEYLTAFASEFLERAGLLLRLDLPTDIPSLHLQTEKRHHLFLAVREILNNTLKHSGATEVEMGFRCEYGQLKILLKDNGRGFPAEISALGEGIGNLHARLSEIGGSCEMNSNSSGTSVSLSLPFTDSKP